jgi:hypothetical protein
MPGEAAEGPKNHPELSALADVLANVRRWSDTDSEMRSLKPWIEDWSADAEVYASKLRDLSVSDWAIESHVNERLEATAEKLDEVAQFRHYPAKGKLQRRVQLRRLCVLMRDLVDSIEVRDETQRKVLEAIAKLPAS